jgi:hypothetical protein
VKIWRQRSLLGVTQVIKIEGSNYVLNVWNFVVGRRDDTPSPTSGAPASLDANIAQMKDSTSNLKGKMGEFLN